MPEIIGNLDELIGLVRRSARQDALDATAAAHREAAQLQEQAQVEAEALQRTIQAAAEAEMRAAHRHIQAQTALENRRQWLIVREAVLEQVWAAAEQSLRALPTQPDYSQVLRQLACAAAEALHEPIVTLAADPQGQELLTLEHLAAWSAEAAVQFVRAEQPAPIWGGLHAWGADPRRRIDASFATRLALARTELREQIAELLELGEGIDNRKIREPLHNVDAS